eukprot:scaffold54381_cov58-Attheya_sp.AAC.1
MSVASSRKILQVAARAFVCPGFAGGGNPVTVFLPLGDSNTALSSLERSKLAKTCEWESVIAHRPNGDGTSLQKDNLPRFHFYMPSGEEVSFCAHAAIGACAILAEQDALNKGSDSIIRTLSFQTSDGSLRTATVSGNEAELVLDTVLEEKAIDDKITMDKIMFEVGLSNNEHVTDEKYPWHINSSIARPKTLVPISSIEKLHSATKPKDAGLFRTLCDSIDSTGIYLYSPCDPADEESGANPDRHCFECRQFPRASGYPEDPATGIAAGALASSLLRRGVGNHGETFEFYQGTIMGRRSKINIRFGVEGGDEKGSGDDPIRMYCSGMVEITSRSVINNMV